MLGSMPGWGLRGEGIEGFDSPRARRNDILLETGLLQCQILRCPEGERGQTWQILRCPFRLLWAPHQSLLAWGSYEADRCRTGRLNGIATTAQRVCHSDSRVDGQTGTRSLVRYLLSKSATLIQMVQVKGVEAAHSFGFQALLLKLLVRPTENPEEAQRQMHFAGGVASAELSLADSSFGSAAFRTTRGSLVSASRDTTQRSVWTPRSATSQPMILLWWRWPQLQRRTRTGPASKPQQHQVGRTARKWRKHKSQADVAFQK